MAAFSAIPGAALIFGPVLGGVVSDFGLHIPFIVLLLLLLRVQLPAPPSTKSSLLVIEFNSAHVMRFGSNICKCFANMLFEF